MKKERTQSRNPKPYRIHSPTLRKSLLRNNGAGGGSGGPTTPQFKWKLTDACPSNGSSCESDKAGVVSARKLAANIWLVNGSFGFDEPNIIEPLKLNQCQKKNYNQSHILTSHSRNNTREKLCDPLESSTKWDPKYQTQSMFPKDTSILRSELNNAHARITELESERHSSNKKLDHLIKKLSLEKESWRIKEHEKIRSIINSIKEDLHRERKTRQKIEIVNSKLVNELTEAKLSTKRLQQDYEKEKKNREVLEEVCDDLAKEIGEDKSEVEELKRSSIRVQQEVEEERKLLQMAEVWREERVQMKLVDAKVTLEEKYSELSKLQSQIELFLSKTRGFGTYDDVNKEAELLNKEVESVKGEEVKKFTYEPPNSEDIYSIFEEIKSNEEVSRKEIVGLENDASGCETDANLEEHGSSNSVNSMYEESNASVSGENDRANSETSDVCSVETKRSRKKASSVTRFWKYSRRNSFEVTNGRMNNATLSPEGTLGGTNVSSPSVKNWSSPESVKQIINRGVKGIIDHWPRGVQKQGMKGKVLEARGDIQKIQLRHALEQTI